MPSSDQPSRQERPPRGRFAPSPTGFLHLGHAQTMLLAWLQMRALGGSLVMRVEDVDSGRRRAEAVDAIYEDLRWLGFDWDEGPDVGGPFAPYLQSQRLGSYRDCLDRLQEQTFLCTCTRKEVRALSDADFGELRYPGTCRVRPTRGGPAALRLQVGEEALRWEDLALGPLEEDPSAVCGDFILQAKNGDFAYQLACVADDIAMGITHVLRGMDLASSTGRQLLLYRWLGAEPPRFAHVPLRRDEDGERLAKTRGSLPIRAHRERGLLPEDLLGGIAFELGLLDQAEPARPADLIESFAARRPELCRGA